MRIEITKANQLDSFQAEDVHSDLTDLIGKSCHNEAGERVRLQATTASHTLTKVVVDCLDPEDVGDLDLELEEQAERLDAVLNVIDEGQRAYGAAAIDCLVWLDPPPGQSTTIGGKQIGEIWTHFKDPPRDPVSHWTQDSIGLDVSHRPGWRLIIQTDHILAPTLDRWDTLWFTRLCQEMIVHLDKVAPQERPMWNIWWPLPDVYMQHINIKFQPNNMQGCASATVGTFMGVMKTLIALFQRLGATPLLFNLVNRGGCHVGVGYLEFGDVPPELELLNPSMTNTTKVSVSR